MKNLFLLVFLLLLNLSCSTSYQMIAGNSETLLAEQYSKVSITGNKFVSDPCIVEDKIYLLDEKGYLISYSILERRLLWKTKIAADYDKLFWGHIIFSSGKLFVSNGSEILFVFDATKGYEIIRKSFPNLILEPHIVISDEKIVVRIMDGQVFAYDFAVMQFIWKYDRGYNLANQIFTNSLIFTFNNLLFFTVKGSNIVCLDKFSGKEIWTAEEESDFDLSLVNVINTVVIDDALLLLTSDGSIVKLDLASGKKLWSKKNLAAKFIFLTSRDKLLILTDSSIYTASLSKDGLEVLQKEDLSDLLYAKEYLHFVLPVKNNKRESYYVFSNLGKIFEVVPSLTPIMIAKSFAKNMKMALIMKEQMIFITDNALYY